MDYDIWRSWSKQDIDIFIYLRIYEEILYVGTPGQLLENEDCTPWGLAREGNLDILRSWSMDYDM